MPDRSTLPLSPADLSDAGFSDAPIQDARTFEPTSYGSGAFGHWQLDGFGLPGYSYEMDQYANPTARYPNSLGLDRRDHWSIIGNDRFIGLATNDGYVQVYAGDRGGVFLNRFDDASAPDGWLDTLVWLPDTIRLWLKRLFLRRRLRQQERMLQHWRITHPAGSHRIALAQEIQDALADDVFTAPRRGAKPHHYSGGFGFLDDGEATWCTGYRYRPLGAVTRRWFGTGYFETELTYRDVSMRRRVYSPAGNDPVMIAEITIRNLSSSPKSLRHYEYWDVNIQQLRASWFQTGLPGRASVESREAINTHFAQSVVWDADRQLLRAHLKAIDLDAPPPDQVSAVDWYPADIFLADLEGQAAAVYTDAAAFFGDGDPRKAAAVVNRLEGSLRPAGPATEQPFCLVQRRDLTLAPNEIVQLRYAYGTLRPDETPDWLAAHRHTALDHSIAHWKDRLAYFSTGGDPVVQREMAWHAYCLQAASVYNAYYRTHVITQGSAYLYLHGLDGAPRDQSLFAMPMTYLRPDLARETLILIMSITRADSRAMAYAFSSYGVVDSALIHHQPSDLDLFFLMALSEYLAATGDVQFLDQVIPFYSPPAAEGDTNTENNHEAAQGDTVLDHARVAVEHLLHDIGIGDFGLLRIGDGDWSDGIVIDSASSRLFLGVSYELSVAKGESVPNAQMALYVLPLAANVLESHAPDLAATLRAALPPLQTAVEKQWTGRWYTRAILRDVLDQSVAIGKYTINLEAQPWALISNTAADSGHEAALIDSINSILDASAPIGAPSQEHGLIAPAIAQLLTWGYSRSRPDLAWRSLLKQLFATHATIFPNVWFGIWTGPDLFNGTDGPNPGGTWLSPATPMTDFPATNSNPHAMALLALIRLCGIEPAADGLLIAPRIPRPRFILDLPLIRLEVTPVEISGEYRAANDGTRTLYVTFPADAEQVTAMVAGQAVVVAPDSKMVALSFSFRTGEHIPFAVKWTPLPEPPTEDIPGESEPPIEVVRL